MKNPPDLLIAFHKQFYSARLVLLMMLCFFISWHYWSKEHVVLAHWGMLVFGLLATTLWLSDVLIPKPRTTDENDLC